MPEPKFQVGDIVFNTQRGILCRIEEVSPRPGGKGFGYDVRYLIPGGPVFYNFEHRFEAASAVDRLALTLRRI